VLEFSLSFRSAYFVIERNYGSEQSILRCSIRVQMKYIQTHPQRGKPVTKSQLEIVRHFLWLDHIGTSWTVTSRESFYDTNALATCWLTVTTIFDMFQEIIGPQFFRLTLSSQTDVSIWATSVKLRKNASRRCEFRNRGFLLTSKTLPRWVLFVILVLYFSSRTLFWLNKRRSLF
jgi:hypothetical protein